MATLRDYGLQSDAPIGSPEASQFLLQMKPAGQAPGLPSLPNTGSSALPQKTLPQGQPSRLSSFANAVNEATRLAREKRNALSLQMMQGAPSGTVAASDFNSILSNMNQASANFTQPLIKSAMDEFEQQQQPQSVFKQQAIGDSFYELELDPATGRLVSQREVFKIPGKGKVTPGDDDDPTTVGERQAVLRRGAFSKARPELESNIGEDGYVDPKVYLKLRSDYAEAIGDVSEFDDAFSSLLSPQQRANIGIGKSVGLKAEQPEEDGGSSFWEYLGNLF